jgi:hypothetical protein
VTTGDPLEDFVGLGLCAVTFILDYVQLQFDAPHKQAKMNVLTPITVRAGDRAKRSGESGFRDALCEQIRKQVVRAQVVAGDALTLTFDDGSAVILSLAAVDYEGPEAVHLIGMDGRWAVL